MRRLVRPSTPADAHAIVALFAGAGMQPNSDPATLNWKYWEERGDWPQPRSFVFTSGAEVIAHGALIPGSLLAASGREPTGHVIDWVARRGEIGAGVTLMKHIAQQTGALIAIGGSEDTLRILPHIGFQPLGTATSYVRTLFPLRLLKGIRNPGWRALPRAARSLLWKIRAPGMPAASPWSSREISSDADLQALVTVMPVVTPGMTVLGRGVDLLRHALRCPALRMQLYALENSGRLRGYFLLACAPGQVRIVDCWVHSPEEGDWGAMLLCAVERAKADPQAAEIVIRASDPMLTIVLPRYGFHARGQTPVRVRPANGASMPPAPLRVQMLDNDAAFFHEDHKELWA